MFNKWQAQRWWGENYDRIMELYNVQRFSRQGLPTPPRSEDEVSAVNFIFYLSVKRERPVVFRLVIWKSKGADLAGPSPIPSHGFLLFLVPP